MKKHFLRFFAASICAALMFVSCEGIGEGDGAFRDYDSEALNMEFYFDETEAEQFTFTVTGSWSSRIVGENTDWVIFNPETGDGAGEYTLEVQPSSENTGEERRQAVIQLICGNDVLPISVVQYGENDAPAKPGERIAATRNEILDAWLISQYDTDSNGRLSISEAQQITKIEFPYKGGDKIGADSDMGAVVFFRDFPNLTKIDLSGHAVKAVEFQQSWSEDPYRLEYLDLSGNALEGGFTLYGLDKLKYLDVSGNQITGMVLYNIFDLVELHCSNNLIEALTIEGQIDGQWASSEALDIIDISHNRITRLYDEDNDLLFDIMAPALKTLDLSYNGLKVYNSANMPGSIETLNLSHNGMEWCDLGGNIYVVNPLRTVDCSYNKLTEFDMFALGLEYADLRENPDLEKIYITPTDYARYQAMSESDKNKYINLPDGGVNFIQNLPR